jgi:hypothetical protein
MQYLLLGLVALLLLLLALRVYTTANPQVMARQVRVGAGVAALAGAAFLVARGMAHVALSLAALGAWLLWGRGGLQWRAVSPQPSSGRTSRVATDHLEVELDHASGEIRGRVLKGTWAGREIGELTPSDLARLWQDCRFADPQSAQILEAYLDRRHPTWREDLARSGEQASSAGAGEGEGKLTRAQALKVLGLPEDASEAEIRRAHRELMIKVHPDHGGSSFLAAKINEAKEALLGKRG